MYISVADGAVRAAAARGSEYSRDMQLVTSVAYMRAGQSGVVVGFRGGRGMVARLNAMGVRPGVYVSKRMAQPFRGPVVIRAGATELALGFGVAQRIMVRVSG